MKLTKKLLGIAAIIAAVGFISLPLTGCPADSDDGDSGTTIVPDNSGDKTGGNTGDKTPITVADISITAPTKDAVPATTTFNQEQERFTAGTVTWSPNDNTFKGGVAYTATVTLTAKSGYTFSGLIEANAKINGDPAVLSNNTGETVTLSRTFSKTSDKTVKSIEIIAQPTKLTYNHGDTIELAGLVVKLTYVDDTTDDVVAANFSTYNIATDPGHGVPLERWTYNAKPVTITYGELTPLETSNLTINPINVSALTIDAIPEQTFTGNEIKPALSVKFSVLSGTARELKINEDYTASYSNNVNVGTATVTITGIGDYTGSRNANFTIIPANLLGNVNISPSTATVNTQLTASYSGSDTSITTWQWKKDGVNIGTNSNTFTPTAVGSYTVTASAIGYNPKTSAVVDVSSSSLNTLSGTPTIVSNTVDNRTMLATINELTANYSGSETITTWIWEKGGNRVGTNSNKFKPTEAGDYTVTVSAAGYNPETSAAVTVSIYTVDSTSSFDQRLARLPVNTADTAYKMKINVSDIAGTGGYTSLPDHLKSTYEYGGLGAANKKYVILDLSDSTFTSISASAFSGCTTLVGITLPNSVNSIGDFAFSDCTSLTSITIGNGVTSIGAGAFSNCNNLTIVTIPNSVNTIGDYSFSSCTSLTAINMDAGNNTYSSQDGVLYNKAKTILIHYPASKIDNTFTIPNSVTTIKGAFNNCKNLTSVTIPNNVTSIEEGAFAGTTSLTTINVNAGNSAYSLQDGVLYNIDKTLLHTYPAGKTNNTFTIPNGVTSIGDGAFGNCNNLTSVTIPDSVTSIGAAAFPYCANLTSITIPNSVTSIGYLAFDSCTSLTSIRFERANTTIGITGVPIPTFINAANDTSLKSAYSSGGIGTYTRPNTSSTTWTKTSN